MSDVTFRAFPQFNDPDKARTARLRHRVGMLPMDWFGDRSAPDRLAHALAERRAIHLKELLEAFEFHERSRKRVRAPVMADLCCGHGLVGLLFACEPTVDRVILLDRARPDAHDAILDAVASVVPAVRDKVEFVQADITSAADHLEPGCGVVAVHACGVRTDRCLDAAIAVGASRIAAMPCCYAQTARSAPPGLRKALGQQTLTDVHRTYRLHEAGYDVDWASIPSAITPMNRVLIARRR